MEDDGKQQHYVFLEGTITARAKVSAQITVISAGGSERVATQISPFESLLDVAQKHNVVADALTHSRAEQNPREQFCSELSE